MIVQKKILKEEKLAEKRIKWQGDRIKLKKFFKIIMKLLNYGLKKNYN